MQANITLGQFLPGSSPVHRLDPRTKILLMIVYIVMIFLVQNTSALSLTVFLLPTVLLLVVFAVAKVPISYLWSAIKPMRLLVIFMFILNLFFTHGERILWHWWIISITEEALLQSIFITLRLILLVAGTSMLTLTTSPIALTDGLERLLAPLKIFHFPSHELAMMMTIALRFIPTLMEETERIQKAQMARGADFESGNLIARAKSMIPILVPLFVSAFRRADELAMAMESRCYHGGEGRTRMRELHLHAGDAIAAVLMLLVTAGIVVLQTWVLKV
ncbi:MAG: energy-coupling factor transporter transmembrane component T [Clostridia bacterium]